MGAFQYDNPLIMALSRIANMMIVSFFWMVCCLPVVTILPATAALFHTTTKVIRGNGNGVIRDFFLSFKDSLKKGILLSLVCLVSGGLLSFALWYSWNLQGQSGFWLAYFLIGCLIIFSGRSPCCICPLPSPGLRGKSPCTSVWRCTLPMSTC